MALRRVTRERAIDFPPQALKSAKEVLLAIADTTGVFSGPTWITPLQGTQKNEA
jgi:hypothetical protein